MKKFVALLLCISAVTACASCKSKKTIIKEADVDVIIETSVPSTEEVTAEPTAAPTEEPVVYTFTGKAFAVVDVDTGEVILSENGDERNYIASITKLLTASVALNHLSMDENITVKSEWLKLLKTDSSIDTYGIKGGNTYSVRDLMKMLLVKSYADAALSLMYATEEKTGADFIELMNNKAQLLGMENSSFDNPIGLDIGNGFYENYSTAEDAAKLMAHAMEIEEITEICSVPSVTLDNGKKLDNTNNVLNGKSSSEYFTVMGGKTGATNAAGCNLAVGAESTVDGKHYAVAYIHGSNWSVLNSEIISIIEYVSRGKR